MPGLAIARELRDRHGAEVRFVGTARGLETRLVPEAGFPLELIRVGQLKNVSVRTRLRTMGDLPLGIARCVGLLRRFKPDVVVGVGGYASGPAMLAAILLRVPTLAFEPNAVPGLANRLVGKRVSAAAVNFKNSARYFRNAVVTGIPVRAEFFAVPAQNLKDHAQAKRLLVFGGSQGARVLNETMPLIARELLERVAGLTVVHQCGAGQLEATGAAYAASGSSLRRWSVREFLTDMAAQFAEADLILCRSGASTLAELAAAGRPAVLVPFPGAADDHQRVNAEAFAAQAAAVMVEQGPGMSALLADCMFGLLSDPRRCAAMGERARTLGHADATARIAELCVSVSVKK